MMRYADNSFVSNPGSPLHTLYAPKVLSNGIVDLVESGVENTDDIIQSFADSVDIRTILTRVSNGEVDLLKKRVGSYGDFTGTPRTYAEALQLEIDSKKLFSSLPADIREKFNNDANQFFAQSGTADWFDKIGTILPDEMRSMNNKKTAETSVEPAKPLVEEK